MPRASAGPASGWAPTPAPSLRQEHGARHANLRRHNLSLVLRQVLESPQPLSRADIAGRTGLTRATVSALVDRLVAGGMVRELEPLATRRAGRPAVPLAPAAGALAGIGLEVNVHYVGALALDLAGHVLVDRVQVTDLRSSTTEAVVRLLAELAAAVLDEMEARGTRVVGAGLALPGLVDHASGVLRSAPNLGWRDVVLADLLSLPPLDSLGLVELGNEANLAAWAEIRRHPDPSPSFVYVSGEVGVGGGLVHEGHVYQGRRGWSGELGHTTVEPEGPACSCGSRGCLEQYAGKDALMAGAGLDPLVPVDRLIAELEAGSVAARSAVERAGWALGVALSNVINILDVEEVVLGGIYAPLASHLEGPIAEQVRTRVLSAAWSRPYVRPMSDGQGAARVGAALSVLRAVVADPDAWVADGRVTAGAVP